ncbi:lemA family protein [Clostridium sp. CAG:451]|jgi:LemA protein|nr:lemA family protein [Clostridium sp. CAG:451]
MWLWIILAIIILIIIYAFILYNNFISLDNKVKEAFSTMDVYLKKRWDLIPNLVENVKGYAKYEEETLTRITKLRNTVYNEMTNDEKIINNEELSSDVSKIMALKEAYPELKANENFIDLSNKLTKIEDDIANARKYYNGTVRIYNNKVQMFPNNIFAKIFNYKTKRMFEASLEDKQNIRINL